MTDSLADILGKRSYNEPPEVGIIKRFIKETFDAEAQVAVQERQIIIGVRSAALAGSLRMRLHELKKLCETDKRLIIRIG